MCPVNKSTYVPDATHLSDAVGAAAGEGKAPATGEEEGNEGPAEGELDATASTETLSDNGGPDAGAGPAPIQEESPAAQGQTSSRRKTR